MIVPGKRRSATRRVRWTVNRALKRPALIGASRCDAPSEVGFAPRGRSSGIGIVVISLIVLASRQMGFAEITVRGITDREVIADRATFEIEPAPTRHDRAWLDGIEVGVDA